MPKQLYSYIRILGALLVLMLSNITAQNLHAADAPAETATDKVQKVADATKQASQNCVKMGMCIPAMIFCTRNLLCYNNCEIGDDPEAMSKAYGAAVLGALGMEAAFEGNSLLDCRKGCVAKSISDCNEQIPGCTPTDDPKCLKPKEQPKAYFNIPASADPALICREYCGAVPEWPEAASYKWCDRRCSALDPLSECFKKNKGAADIQKVCQYDGKSRGGESATREKEALVAIKLNSFVQEATCIHEQEAGRPDSDACKYLCADKTGVEKEQAKWLRTCAKKMADQLEADYLKQRQTELSLKQAADAAMNSATEGFLAVHSTTKTVEKVQAERAGNEADYAAQQAKEQAQAEKELEAEKNNTGG